MLLLDYWLHSGVIVRLAVCFMENDISLGQFDRWLYGALRKSDTPSRVKPKEPWPYRVVAGLNRVLEILLDSILEDFI